MIVADTGPINYLVLIDQAHLLPALSQIVSLPAPVVRELSHPETPAIVREWAGSPPGWLRVHPGVAVSGLDALDAGERSAIGLARELGIETIAMDDRAAVKVARSLGFKVVGTVGILERAADEGLIDLAHSFVRLRQTNFHVRSTLLDEMLARHATRQQSGTELG